MNATIALCVLNASMKTLEEIRRLPQQTEESLLLAFQTGNQAIEALNAYAAAREAESLIERARHVTG
jgi:hypothetical protein